MKLETVKCLRLIDANNQGSKKKGTFSNSRRQGFPKYSVRSPRSPQTKNTNKRLFIRLDLKFFSIGNVVVFYPTLVCFINGCFCLLLNAMIVEMGVMSFMQALMFHLLDCSTIGGNKKILNYS